MIITITEKSHFDDAINEFWLLQACQHPYMIKCIDKFMDDDQLKIVMQYANSGSLQKLIEARKANKQPFSETEILKYFTQLCLAIRSMHSKGYIHCDISSENIFFMSDGY